MFPQLVSGCLKIFTWPLDFFSYLPDGTWVLMTKTSTPVFFLTNHPETGVNRLSSLSCVDSAQKQIVSCFFQDLFFFRPHFFPDFFSVHPTIIVGLLLVCYQQTNNSCWFIFSRVFFLFLPTRENENQQFRVGFRVGFLPTKTNTAVLVYVGGYF